MELENDLIQDIIEEGEEDYLDISTIAYLYKLEHGTPPGGLDVTATEIALELIRRGLITPGILDDGFHPWGLPTEESIELIQRDVRAALRDSALLAPGQVCWFDITDRAVHEYLNKAT